MSEQKNPMEEGITDPPVEKTPTLDVQFRDIEESTPTREPISLGGRRTFKRKGGKRKQKRNKSSKKKRHSYKRR
jgi:hypothetical protein